MCWLRGSIARTCHLYHVYTLVCVCDQFHVPHSPNDTNNCRISVSHWLHCIYIYKYTLHRWATPRGCVRIICRFCLPLVTTIGTAGSRAHVCDWGAAALATDQPPVATTEEPLIIYARLTKIDLFCVVCAACVRAYGILNDER